MPRGQNDADNAPADLALEALVAIVVGVALALIPLKQVQFGWSTEWTDYDPGCVKTPETRKPGEMWEASS
jgi:hypothetical protein